jgi:hypothetical protein
VVVALVVLAPAAMGMDERGVVVLVLVIVGSVLELSEHAARVVVGDVIVVMSVSDGCMRVLVVNVANDVLGRACWLQGSTPSGLPGTLPAARWRMPRRARLSSCGIAWFHVWPAADGLAGSYRTAHRPDRRWRRLAITINDNGRRDA